MNEQTINQQRFAGGGTKMSALIGARDWSTSSLGPLARWPEGLRVVTSLMLETSDPAFIAWGPEFILLYNDGYAELLGPKHPAALGASLDKVWPELWREYRQFAEAAMSGQTTLRRDVPFTLERGGLDKQVYFTFSISPLRGKDGDVAGLYCTCLETTSEVLARKTLNAEAMQLRELFRQAPGFMTVLRGPDHVFEVVNDAYRRLIGGRDVLGKSVREALPEVAKQGFVQLLDRVLETGEPFNARRTPITLQNTLNEAPEHLILDFVYQPIRDWSGSVTGIFVEGSDVTETACADERVKASERFARATIDSLAEQIAVIDETGQLLEVNVAWREFAAGQGVVPNAVSEQRNYLKDCDKAAAAGDKDAREIASIIRAVTAGERDWAIWEYARDFVPDKRWFSVKISRFHDDGPVRVVVAHEEITERRKSEQRIQYLATHDELTGLPNRHLLADRAQQAIEHARRSNLGLALLFIDLDNFKYLNDAFGHWVGDSILESVAHELSRLVRAGDTVARIGGDEFVILLSDLPNLLQGATSVSRKLRERFSHPLPLKDRETTVTLSIGVSLFPADGATLDELMRKADAAMYRAKSLGRGAVQFYSAEMSASANNRAILESELRRALRLNQFELYYQPQVLTATDALVGMEALLRWPHPERGFIAPDKFIPVATAERSRDNGDAKHRRQLVSGRRRDSRRIDEKSRRSDVSRQESAQASLSTLSRARRCRQSLPQSHAQWCRSFSIIWI
jgi:diguanylate cyclase (GGDEF)-like protein